MDALQTVCSTWTKDMKAWFREMKAWFRNMKAGFRNMKAWFRDMKDWLLGIAENCCLILYCLQCLWRTKKCFSTSTLWLFVINLLGLLKNKPSLIIYQMQIDGQKVLASFYESF